MHNPISAIEWRRNSLALLDQTKLPNEEVWVVCEDVEEVADAIRCMVTRGAPAIGIAAAYGVVLAARSDWRIHGAAWKEHLDASLEVLRHARPTAVNLRWAVNRMATRAAGIDGDPEPQLLREAQAIHDEDRIANQRMADTGMAYIENGSSVITHCNTGALATGGHGTALGVIRSAFAAGRIQQVYACETRPWLQGSRLTMWELGAYGMPATLIADSAAAFVMQTRSISWVILGADRIAANGDVANKVGTYNLAVAAQAHDVRFMVVAPTSTIDSSIENGAAIPLEQRDADELRRVAGKRVAPAECQVWNPVFDVTPAHLIDLIVTERGVVEHPAAQGMQSVL